MHYAGELVKILGIQFQELIGIMLFI